jgi:hypothetical protein
MEGYMEILMKQRKEPTNESGWTWTWMEHEYRRPRYKEHKSRRRECESEVSGLRITCPDG